jgi:hypothetical protein
MSVFRIGNGYYGIASDSLRSSAATRQLFKSALESLSLPAAAAEGGPLDPIEAAPALAPRGVPKTTAQSTVSKGAKPRRASKRR